MAIHVNTLNGGDITVNIGDSTPKWHVQALVSSEGIKEDWDGESNPYINPIYQDFILEGTYEDSSYEDENISLRIYRLRFEDNTPLEWIIQIGDRKDTMSGYSISDEGDEQPTKKPEMCWAIQDIEWK